MATPAIPSIDLSDYFERGNKAAVAHAMARACEDIGFLTIVNHGVPAELIRELSTRTFEFFDQPPADKMSIAAKAGFGYIRVGGEQLGATLDLASVDYKESLNLKRPMDEASWPTNPAMRHACARYLDEMVALAGRLMRVFASALNLPEAWFADKTDHASAILRLLNYPPAREIAPGATWAAEHTDYGILTILWSPESAGLQAKARSGEWVDVHASPDAFIINIGDLLMNWTNDRWVSTLHRVVPTVRDIGRRRQSIPFFYNPNPDALIECLPGCSDAAHPPRYAPILAREHLQMKIDKALK